MLAYPSLARLAPTGPPIRHAQQFQFRRVW